MTNNQQTRNRRNISSKKTLYIILGVGIPLLSVLFSGFYTLDENEVALVVEYDVQELFPSNTDLWTHLITLKEAQLSGGSMQIAGPDFQKQPLFSFMGRDIYWHQPAPLGKHHNIDIYQEFQIELPLVIPDYMYERDEDGNLSVCIPAQVLMEFVHVVTWQRLEQPLSLSEAIGVVEDYVDTGITIIYQRLEFRIKNGRTASCAEPPLGRKFGYEHTKLYPRAT